MCGIWRQALSNLAAQLLRHASAEFVLALAPVTAVPARAHRTAAMRRINPVLDGFLNHGIQSFGKAPVFGTDLITLLDHLHGLGFGNSVQTTKPLAPGVIIA